jgi:hypothetical protein
MTSKPTTTATADPYGMTNKKNKGKNNNGDSGYTVVEVIWTSLSAGAVPGTW